MKQIAYREIDPQEGKTIVGQIMWSLYESAIPNRPDQKLESYFDEGLTLERIVDIRDLFEYAKSLGLRAGTLEPDIYTLTSLPDTSTKYPEDHRIVAKAIYEYTLNLLKDALQQGDSDEHKIIRLVYPLREKFVKDELTKAGVTMP